MGGAQLGQLPGHEEVAGGLALIHLPRTVLAGIWRGRKDEECNRCDGEFMNHAHCTVYIYNTCSLYTCSVPVLIP